MAAPVLTIDGTNQTAKILDRTLRLGRNTLDVILIDPTTNIPQLNDAVTLTNPTWSGTVTTRTLEDRSFEGHKFYTLICTNDDDLTLAAGGSLSDATNDYRNLVITETRKDGVNEIRGTLETYESGHLPGHTFELTSATHGYTNEEFTIQEVNIEWFTDDVPLFKLTFGDEMVTLSSWAQSDDAGVLPITTTKITDGAVTTPKVAANAITATEIASGAITTAKLNASAVIALVTNSGATVVIDASGITVTDGSIVIEDEFASTVIQADGIFGSWQDFLTHGLYNGSFTAGVVGSISTGRTADCPYWTFTNVGGSPEFDLTSDDFVSIEVGSSEHGRMAADRVSVRGDTAYQVTMPWSASATSGVFDIIVKILWYDDGGSYISTTTLDTVTVSANTLAHFYATPPADSPSEAKFAEVQVEADHVSGSTCTLFVNSVSLVPGLVGEQSTVDLTVASSNIRGSVLVPFSWSGTLPGSSTQDLDIFDAGSIAQMRMPFNGSVIGICIALGTARTAGTLTAQAYNGSTSSLFGPTAVIDGTTTNNVTGTADIGDATFSATNFLRLRVTTSSFTPTSNTVKGFLIVQYNVE